MKRITASAALIAVGFAGVLTLHLRSDSTCFLSDDIRRGERWGTTCKACHDIAAYPPARRSGGPNLQNVYLSVAGTQPNFSGRPSEPPIVAAREAGIIWNDANLLDYLKDPQAFLVRATGKRFNKFNYMSFFIGGESNRRDVISYLRALKNSPQCF
jgi:cytochrome c